MFPITCNSIGLLYSYDDTYVKKYFHVCVTSSKLNRVSRSVI